MKICYPISTLPEHLHSTILRTPKLPENTHKPVETSFHAPLTLVPLLANYPHSHYSPPSLGSHQHTPLSSHSKFWRHRSQLCSWAALVLCAFAFTLWFKSYRCLSVSFYRGIQCLLSCLAHILPKVVQLYVFSWDLWGGGVMNLV